MQIIIIKLFNKISKLFLFIFYVNITQEETKATSEHQDEMYPFWQRNQHTTSTTQLFFLWVPKNKSPLKFQCHIE